MKSPCPLTLAGVAIAAFTLLAPTANATPTLAFRQDNLVSDVPGVAPVTDPNLRNPWGMSSSATSPIWVSNQVTGTSTIYNGAGTPQPLVVSMVSGGSPFGPTGQVFNGTSAFTLSNGNAARFLFADLEGSISGWNGGTLAERMVLNSGAAYTGLAIGSSGGGNFLYAANSAQNRIDVYDTGFDLTTLAGNFSDPNLPAGFTVYNVQAIGGELVVTYENEDAGGGVVDAFGFDGGFLRRISANADGGPLASPWGLAIAPASFGMFAGALLVGNEDDGRISAFDRVTGTFLGQLRDTHGRLLENPGLWGLLPGNGGNGGDPGTLYFAAGIGGEQHGLFGTIRAVTVPEPSSLALLAVALVLVSTGAGARAARRR